MREITHSTWIPWAIGIAAAAAVVGVTLHERRTAPPVVGATAPTYADAPLVTATGETTLGALKGGWVLVQFGYMTCPDVCPTTLAYLAREYRALGWPEGRLQVVFVSADPERDAPDALARYVQHFEPSFLGVTATKPNLDAVAKGLGAYYGKEEQPDSAAGYLVTHSSSLFVLDPYGRFVKSLPAPHERGAVVRELKRLAGAAH